MFFYIEKKSPFVWKVCVQSLRSELRANWDTRSVMRYRWKSFMVQEDSNRKAFCLNSVPVHPHPPLPETSVVCQLLCIAHTNTHTHTRVPSCSQRAERVFSCMAHCAYVRALLKPGYITKQAPLCQWVTVLHNQWTANTRARCTRALLLHM